ncbi:MAG TPA: ABC transporter permease [Burkholderiaceae bacterium]|nr:ABC transporter permease [Burkholderiaceae bacterium]
MIRYLLSRLGQGLMLVVVMSLLVFLGLFAIGNPVDILVNPQADQAEIEHTIAALGLDKPLWEQYATFVTKALHGNLGDSFVHGISALNLILTRLPATLELAVVAMLIAILLGIPLGLWAGLRPDSLAGRVIMGGSILGFSLPTFWVGLMLIMMFSVQLQWLPASGRGSTVDLSGVPLSIATADGWKHILLPALNLALFKLSLIVRLTRSGTREALTQDYVRFARAKGLSGPRIVGVHVLKNVLVPIVTVIGMEFGSLLAFSVVTESVFAWPGMGKLLIDSITQLDRPVVVAYLMLVVVLYVTISFVTDVAYSILDPRVRLGGSAT